MIHILFINNPTTARSDIQEVLESEGIQSSVETIHDEEIALPKLASNTYDLVVIGTSQKSINSLKLLQKIKLYHPMQPVLVLSLNNTRSFAIQAMRLNAQGYLTNDTVHLELADAIKSIKLGRSYITTALTA